MNLTDYSDGMKFNRFIGQCGLADHRIEKDGILEEFDQLDSLENLNIYQAKQTR